MEPMVLGLEQFFFNCLTLGRVNYKMTQCPGGHGGCTGVCVCVCMHVQNKRMTQIVKWIKGVVSCMCSITHFLF